MNPHRHVGVPGLLRVGVSDRLERPVLRVRAAGLERHHERLPAGVHDRVRDLEAAGVDPVDDLRGDGCGHEQTVEISGHHSGEAGLDGGGDSDAMR